MRLSIMPAPRSTAGLLVTAISVLLVLCSRDDTVFNADDAREFTGSLSGRVVDRHGRALSGALITARPMGATTVSGADGGFTLSELRAGTHVLQVTLVDYRDTVSDSIEIGLDETRELDSDLCLVYRYGWIRGTVTVQGQQPTPLDAGLQVEFQQANGRTYPNGNYLLHRVEPGLVKLFAAMRNVGYGTVQLTIEPDDTADADILIDKQGGTVSGTILDSTGQPVEDAVVSAVGDILADTTDSAGAYTLTEVPSDGDVCLTVTTSSGQLSVGGISVAEGGSIDMPALRVSDNTQSGAVVLSPAVVFASETDAAIMLVVNALLADTASRIAAYWWDTDDDGDWDDTTATGRLSLAPRSAGQHTVNVQCMTTDSQLSAIVPVSITVAAATLNNPPYFPRGDTAMSSMAYQGIEYVDTVRAIDPDGDVVRLLLIDTLPSGLTLTDSIVRWTPQADSGTQRVRVVADDERGGRDTLEWHIHLAPQPQGVSITTQMPSPIYGRELDTITLFIHAQGAPPLHYRWYHDGAVVGEDTSIYFIDSIHKSDSGQYWVEVWNAFDTVWSDTAMLIVEPPMNDGPWQPQSPQDFVYDAHGMVRILAAGYWFDMGQTGIPGAEPVHQVDFTRDFWMDTVEVTQQEYSSLLPGANPFANPQGGQYPAENVTWYDAVLFCNARSVRDGYDTVYAYSRVNGIPGDNCTLDEVRYLPDRDGYRLPTEAEWEYACRGGTQTDYYWEPDTTQKYAWFYDNSASTIHPVGGLLANQYGLHDMSGNVSEWCFDMYGVYPMTSPADPIGPDTGSTKVVRGGSWGSIPSELASAARSQHDPSHRNGEIGFRCVRQEPPVDAPPVIIGQPRANIDIIVGDSLVMFVTVTGTPPLSYEWYKDSTVVGTAEEYRVAEVDSTHAGTYWVYVSNAFGGTTSNMSVVTVSTGGAQPWQPTGPLEYDRGAVRVHAAGHGFMMGAVGEPDAEPVHEVQFTRDFWMDTVEVTQSLYVQHMGVNPSVYHDTVAPVVMMSWFDAVLFCNERSRSEGLDTVYTYTSYTGTFGNGVNVLASFGYDFSKNGYRLPTEAEWEYACRGGTTTRFFWGDDSLYDTVTTYAYYVSNTGPNAGPAGIKQPNKYGLRDMTGNAFEYCHDFYDPNYYSTSPTVDPMGPPSSPTGIVIRGGAHDQAVGELASARRTLLGLDSYGGVPVGIRCVRTIP
ncbi:MAG: SUMF1/EgtB/PvdO family nonheme iron enzyme [Chitinivibrionales bacterium]|nr:SUMF1/EgtB/PvdO family nonheme iron enzyme [Chitinivibrionales bacterium]